MPAPIVLVHPMWFSSSFWADSRSALAADTRVETPDLPEHGANPGPFTAETATATVTAALRSAGGRADLVGLSLGARVALATAADHPDLVRSLVLMGMGDDVSPLGARIQSLAMRVLGRAASKSVGGTEPLSSAVHAVKAQPDLPLTANAARITCPTLVVAGGADKDYAASCRKAADTITGARLTTIADAEHMWPKDRPDDFVELIRSWQAEREHTA